MPGDALQEFARLERELGRIDADLAELAIDAYNDYRWRGVADPLAVDVGGNPRWKHIQWLEQARMDTQYGMHLWQDAHPDESARMWAERGGPDPEPPSLAAEVARLRQLAGLD